MTDHREPGAGDERPTDDEMTEPGMPELTPAEIESGRDALRELGSVEPLPADVLARLDARLEAELRPAPRVRRRRRRGWPRLAFAVPGIAVALAATVVIVVLANRGESPRSHDLSAASQFKSSTGSVRPKANAPEATAGAGAPSSDAAAPVRVPALAGHSVRDARALARARGLHVTFSPAPCTVRSSSRVVGQRPRAGVGAPVGSTIVLTATCVRPQPSGS
jgi:PASTA domain